jgi:DnaJ-class molecular chaperone
MSKIEKPIVHTDRIDICRNCHGVGVARDERGKLKSEDCDVCDGQGRVRVKKEIRTTIETI